MNTPTLRLNDLPPAFASKLLYTLFSHFLGESIKYDEATNTIICTDCDKFINELKNYVSLPKFNDVMSKYYPLIDGISAGKCLGVQRGKVQDLVKGILNNVKPHDIFTELNTINIQPGPTYVKIVWGINNFIGFKITPPIMVSVDYMEALRKFMTKPLIIRKTKTGKRVNVKNLSKDVISGSYKAIEVSCLVYALVAIGYSLSVITRFRDTRSKKDTYAFLIPLAFDRELIERIRNVSISIRELLKLKKESAEKESIEVNINAVEDHLINLLLISVIRSRSGAVELALLEHSLERDKKEMLYLRLNLSLIYPCIGRLLNHY